MSYVLVSLVGDAATQANDQFARWFAEQHKPSRAFHAAHPDIAEVAAAVREVRVAIVMAHDGGGSIRAESAGAPWLTPEAFARVFEGARVWVYACDTRAGTLESDLDSFGRTAHAAGVSVFAGHATAITAPLARTAVPGVGEVTWLALARAFRCFLRGSNNAREIRRAAQRGGRGRPIALAALAIDEALESLRVLVNNAPQP